MADAAARLDASTRRRGAWVVGLTALAVLWAAPSHDDLNNPNENARFYMSVAMIDDGSYCIDGPWQRWGWINDVSLRDGHRHSVKAPLTSWLAAPVYAAVKFAAGGDPARATAMRWMRLGASTLPFLAFLCWLWPWLHRRAASPLLRDAVFVSVGVGSMLYGYALLLVSHTLAAACAFVAWALLADVRWDAERPASVGEEAAEPGSSGDRARTGDRRRAALAGLLAASVTALEYPGVVVSVLLTLLALLRLPGWGLRALFAAGAALPTLGVMHFQWRAFGHPLRPGHLDLENDSFRAIHEQGVFGADRFHPDAAGALLFDPGFGLLPLTPLWLAALVGLPLLLRRGRPDAASARIAASIVVVGWAVTALLSNWRGGWTIGPRYLCTIAPFVALAALEGLRWLHGRWPRACEGFAVGASAVGLLASGLPSAFYPHLPEAITRPLPQLLLPALRDGLVPGNLWFALGLQGAASMLPWALALLALLLAVATATSWPTIAMPLRRKLALAGPIWSTRLLVGGVVAAALLSPLLEEPTDPAQRAEAAEMVAFVRDHWSPRPGAAPGRPGR